MPGPTPASVFAVALLSAAPEANPTPHPAKLVAAAPTPHPYPVPVIDVVQVDQKLQVQVRSPKAGHKVVLESAQVKVSYPKLTLDDAASKLAPNPAPAANKASPKLMTTSTIKPRSARLDKSSPLLAEEITAKVEGTGAKIELLAGKIEGTRLLSIGCDGVVTDGSSSWRLEGPTAFAFPDGTQIHLQPGGKGGKNACASVDVTSGNQRVHLRAKGSTIEIGKPSKLGAQGVKITSTGQRIVTDNVDPDELGRHFVKLAPAAHKIDGRVAGWAVLENVDGRIRATGIVFDAGDGVRRTNYMKIKMEDVLITSYQTGGGGGRD